MRWSRHPIRSDTDIHTHLVSCEDDVAHHGELAAAAQRVAVDRGDDRRADLGQIVPAGEHVRLVRLHVRLRSHLLDVSASCKKSSLRILDAHSDSWVPANARSLPVMTMAPTPASASKVLSWAFSSLTSPSQSAFSALGRFSVLGHDRNQPGSQQQAFRTSSRLCRASQP